MTRHTPVEAVGQIRVFAPTEKCRSYRLRWTEPDGTPGDTTAGNDPAAAIAKATALDRRLARAGRIGCDDTTRVDLHRLPR